MNKFFVIAAFLVTLLSPGVFGEDKPEETNPEIQRALEISDIRYSRMPPFRLSATVTLTPDNKGPLQGKYVFLKNSDGNWREELTLPGYSRIRVGDEHNYWQTRSMEYDPLPILDIDELIDFPKHLNLEKKWKFTKPSKMKKEGMDVSCQHPKADSLHTETICFESPSGELVSMDNGMSGFQSAHKTSSAIFADFQGIGEKRFPTVLKGFSGKRLLVDIHVNELKEAPDLEAKLFAAPAGSSRWLYCQSPTSSKLSYRVQPVYPQASRQRGEQGVVTFYSVVGENGKIIKLFMIQSAGTDLDKSSAAAVSQWKYDQPMCDGVLAPVETTIDVIFTLQQ